MGSFLESYVSECLLYLLHGVLGLVFWIGYADFFLFDQVPDNVQSDKESSFAICMP